MTATSGPTPDPAVARDLDKAVRLEWATIAGMATVLAVMTWAAGGSEAFRTALIEDWLSLVPAIVFLIAVRWERRPADGAFPYGYHRVNSLAFLIAAVALTGVGGFLLYESLTTLIVQDHPTLAPRRVLGEDVWSGWVMIGALVYSVIPPMILGHIKQPIAKRLHDKVLHTDALMQKADWMTGLAGVLGIFGIAYGLWWADAAAAAFISIDIVRDGLRTLRMATAELVDGVPRALDSDDIAPDAAAVRDHLQALYPDARVSLRETGRYIRGTVEGVDPALASQPDPNDIAGLEDKWRLESVAFTGARRSPGQK